MSRTPSVGYLLSRGGSGLSQVIHRARELKRLTRHLKAIVDEPMCDHIYVANVRDTTLVIGTDSAVWHTRVKYLAPTILEQIKQIPGMEQIRQITFRIQPFSAQSSPIQAQTATAKNGSTRTGSPPPTTSNKPAEQLSPHERDREHSLQQTLRGLSRKLIRKS